jgi:hypothetical protein
MNSPAPMISFRLPENPSHVSGTANAPVWRLSALEMGSLPAPRYSCRYLPTQTSTANPRGGTKGHWGGLLPPHDQAGDSACLAEELYHVELGLEGGVRCPGRPCGPLYRPRGSPTSIAEVAE